MCPFTVMPWAPLALTVLFVGLATVAAWLLDTGWRRRSAWRLALGAPIAGYLVAVVISGVWSTSTQRRR
jgi:hypothetical protein